MKSKHAQHMLLVDTQSHRVLTRDGAACLTLAWLLPLLPMLTLSTVSFEFVWEPGIEMQRVGRSEPLRN